MRQRPVRGASFIELLVGLAVVGVILAAGIPSLASWLLNIKVRNAADSLQNGLRLAQSEAVRRNDTVTLKLTAAAVPVPASPPSPTGTNWIILDPAGNKIQSKTTEGLTNVVMEPQNATRGPASAFTGQISFNGLGRASSLTEPMQFYFYAGTGGDHHMNVFLTPAGRIRFCDYLMTLGVGDPQACE